LEAKVTAGSARVQVVRSSQEITAHSGLVLVRELAARLGVGELLDRLTVKRRRRGFSPAQAVMAIVETLAAGGDCLEDSRLLRSDPAQERLRGHGLPDPTTLGRFLRRFNIGHIAQLNLALDALFARVHPLVERGGVVTLDIDASYVETHGPQGSRQGARGTYAASSAGTHCSASSPRPASGWGRGCARAAPPPAPARSAFSTCCAGSPTACACSCAPTRASGATPCCRRSSSGRSATRSACR
jgi:hypothetical protein